jgi:nascent polypeptide-associated complex subunit alpha
MKQMMKQIGMQMEPIEGVKEVVITTDKGRYIFDSAEVTAMTMQGVTTYQLSGESRFEASALLIPIEDVQLVAAQANVSDDAARAALVATHGDIAEAILKISQP